MSGAATRFRLILFDFDGTLVDSQHLIVEAMGTAFAEADLDRPGAAAVRRIVGLGLEEAVQVLIDGVKGTTGGSTGVTGIAESYRRAYFGIRIRPDHHEPLFPGVREALAGLDRPSRSLGIATGKSRRGLVESLERHDLKHHFATFQTSDGNPGKPDPEMIYRAMDEVGVEAGETVMVGDTVFDMEMAGNAGVEALGVSWGYHDPKELTAAGAAHILDELGGLAPLLSNREKEAL